MSEKHSPLPLGKNWDEPLQFDELWFTYIFDKEKNHIARVEGNTKDECKEHVDLIVNSVNAMPGLVSILTDMLNIVTGQNKDYQIDGAYEDDARHNYPKRNHRIKELIEQALALALAEVKP